MLDAARKELGALSPAERAVRRMSDAAFLAAMEAARDLLAAVSSGAVSRDAFAATVAALPDAELVVLLCTARQAAP